MKGLSSMPSVSNHSPNASCFTTGAKGRNSSRNLILALRWPFISGVRGSARIERAPSARGPHSSRPCRIATTLCSASRLAGDLLGNVLDLAIGDLVDRQGRLDDALRIADAEIGAERVPVGRTVRPVAHHRLQGGAERTAS